MPTQQPRINVTIEPATAETLTHLAAQSNQSVASLARELISEALERREDHWLSALAEEREQGQDAWIEHHDAWQ